MTWIQPPGYVHEVSKKDECFIKNKELCTKNEELFFKMMNFTSSFTRRGRSVSMEESCIPIEES